MSDSPWHSAWWRRRSRRERRVLAAGGAASGIILLVGVVALPYGRAWAEREAALEVRAEQLARLESLLSAEPDIRAALARQEDARGRHGAQLLGGATPAVAAARLQTLIRGYADRSRVVLTRVDAAGESDAVDGALTRVPVELAARGDIYGLIDLLFYLQHGERVLVIDELSVRRADGAGGEDDRAPLTWSIRLHGLYTGG